ncbi:unnamed protein product, partial [Pylaiella littoralis]
MAGINERRSTGGHEGSGVRSGVGVARQKKKKHPKAKLRGGRNGKPVGRKSRSGGVAAAKDVGQKQLGTVVPVAGGMMSATEESKRQGGNLVARYICLRLIACLLFYFHHPPPSDFRYFRSSLCMHFVPRVSYFFFPFRSPASSFFGGLFVVFVHECTPSVFVPSLYLLLYFVFLSSVDHVVTGPCALVCLCLGLSWP